MPLIDRLKQGVDATKFKADQLIRIQRIQGEIASLTKEIASVKERLATLVIDLHQRGELADKKLEEICYQIDQLFSQINQKEAQISAIRAEELPQTIPAGNLTSIMRLCTNCNSPVSVSALFCTSCGNEMPAAPENARFICGFCRNSINQDAAFCPNCGRQVA